MIIEVDDYKNKIESYDPKRSEDFHIESGKMADKDFISQLKTQKYKRIIFMAGGTASGKTEFAYSYFSEQSNLNNKYTLVYDGTLKNYDGFKTKMDKIERYAKNKPSVKIILVIPRNINSSLAAFLKRERKMEIKTFFNTQINSKTTVAKVLKDTKYKVDIYISVLGEGKEKLEFYKLFGKYKRSRKARFLLSITKLIKELAVKNNIEL